MSCNKVITWSVTFIILSSISSSIKSQWVVDDMGCRTPTLGVGNCIPIKQCKIIMDVLLHTSPIPAWMSAELSLYQCGFSGQSIKVCCPYRKSDLDYFYVKLRQPDVGNVNFLRHRNLDLLPKDCGPFQYGDRIVNGERTGLFEFPWMALLSYKTKNGIDFKCAGTVINNRYILTAAHCITNVGDQKLIGVRVGEHNITSPFDCTTLYPNIVECANPVQDVAIDSIIVHPNYDTISHQNDIGLIRLAWALNTSTNNVKPICLPTTKELTNLNFTGNRLTVSGWGKTETGRKSDVLLKVNIPVMDQKRCKDMYKTADKEITENQMCAGGTKEDSCAGDSGGPLQRIENHFDDVRYVQYGVVSYGPRFCGFNKMPGVYTKVESYMPWILDNIK